MEKLKGLVVKDNGLIEMPLDFSLMQLKLFARIIVSMRNEPDREFYEFSVKSLLNDFDLSETNYTQLKLATTGLIRPVILKGLGIDEEDQLPFFDKISYTAKGIVRFRMSSDLKPLILDLEKNYTKYYFSNIARLKSAYSIRIYELLKQYEFKRERLLTVDEIKLFLKIDNDKYLKYSNFKDKVILVAQKELKEKTDIYFEFEEIKEWKKVCSILFIIYKNINNKADIENETFGKSLHKIENKETIDAATVNQEILNTLIDEYKVIQKIAQHIVDSFSEEQILRNIEYTKREHKNGSINKSFTGYLVDAIKNDYANTASLVDVNTKEKADQARKAKQLEAKRESLRSKLSLEFSKVEKEKYLNSLTEAEQEAFRNEILEEIKLDSYSVAMFKKKGLESPIAGMWIIKKITGFEERRDKYIADKLKEAGL